MRRKPTEAMLRHPMFDHQLQAIRPLTFPPPAPAHAAAPSAQAASAPQRPQHQGWGGRRAGAGVKPGTFNHMVHGRRSALIRRAVQVLADNPELRPFLLLITRAAVQGELPSTTRQIIREALAAAKDAKTV